MCSHNVVVVTGEHVSYYITGVRGRLYKAEIGIWKCCCVQSGMMWSKMVAVDALQFTEVA